MRLAAGIGVQVVYAHRFLLQISSLASDGARARSSLFPPSTEPFIDDTTDVRPTHATQAQVLERPCLGCKFLAGHLSDELDQRVHPRRLHPRCSAQSADRDQTGRDVFCDELVIERFRCSCCLIGPVATATAATVPAAVLVHIRIASRQIDVYGAGPCGGIPWAEPMRAKITQDMRSQLDLMISSSEWPMERASYAASIIGSIRLGSLCFTLPTRVLTGQLVISEAGYGARRALSRRSAASSSPSHSDHTSGLRTTGIRL